MVIGTTEILVILAIVVFLFGAKKLPELARSLGKAQGEYHKSKREAEAEGRREEAAKAAAAAAPESEDDKTRRAASAMGIDTAGKSVDEIKTEMRRRLA